MIQYKANKQKKTKTKSVQRSKYFKKLPEYKNKENEATHTLPVLELNDLELHLKHKILQKNSLPAPEFHVKFHARNPRRTTI